MRANVLVEGRSYGVELSARTHVTNGYTARIVQGEQVLFEGQVQLVIPRQAAQESDVAGVGAVVQVRLQDDGPTYMLECGYANGAHDAYLYWESREYWVRRAPALSTERLSTSLNLTDADTLESPMPGKVLKVMAAVGDTVTDEQPLVIIEAMKMEFTVRAPHAGVVAAVRFAEGAQVAAGDILVELEK
jgi:biotin carboxyl carrier protein